LLLLGSQSPSSSLNHPAFLNSRQPPDSWPTTAALPPDHLRLELELSRCSSLLQLPTTQANHNPRHRPSSYHLFLTLVLASVEQSPSQVPTTTASRPGRSTIRSGSTRTAPVRPSPNSPASVKKNLLAAIHGGGLGFFGILRPEHAYGDGKG